MFVMKIPTSFMINGFLIRSLVTFWGPILKKASIVTISCKISHERTATKGKIMYIFSNFDHYYQLHLIDNNCQFMPQKF